jgi:hypothetical protein
VLPLVPSPTDDTSKRLSRIKSEVRNIADIERRVLMNTNRIDPALGTRRNPEVIDEDGYIAYVPERWPPHLREPEKRIIKRTP